MTNNKHEAGTGHGSAADRGSADRYYGRSPSPHRIINYVRIEAADLTAEAIAAYHEGYKAEQDRKSWD